jgi:photosystem II stability/assembly factor-like uncharacterized protein
VIDRTLILAVFVSFLALPCNGSAQGWEWQNPRPHGYGINDIVMADQDWVYAPCADGNFLRSGDGGRNWVSAKIASRAILKVASPTKGVVVIILEDATVMRSTDYGSSWVECFRPATTQTGGWELKRISDTELLALLGTNILIRSSDAGASWSPITFKPTGNESFRALSVQSRSVWRLFSWTRAYKTTNAGGAWVLDSSFQVNGLTALQFVDSLYGYQLRNGQLLQTRDGGAQWKEMDLFGFANNLSVSAGPRLGRTVYVLSDGKYLVNKSTDEGDSWNISLTSTAFYDGYANAMSFADAEHGIVVGEGGRIVRTENGGTSWSIVRGLGYIGPLSDMVFPTPRDGIVLTYTPTILLTTNGGARWDESVAHPDYTPRRISMYTQDAGYVYAFDDTYRIHVLQTTNRGQSWSYRGMLPLSASDARFVQPQNILAVSADTVFIGVSDGILYRSVDGAQTWDSLYTCASFNNDWESGVGLFWFPPRTLIYSGTQCVARSTDAGTTWTCRNTNTIRNVQFFSPDTATAVASGRTGVSFDGGYIWNPISDDGPAFLQFFNLQEGIGVSNQIVNGERTGVLWRTTNGGADWATSRLHESIENWYGMHFLSMNEGWAYGYGGMIRHTTNGGITDTRGPASIPDGRMLAAPYPNPFSVSRHGAVTVSMRLTGAAECRVVLSLYSIVGTRIATLLDASLSGGVHVVAFDAHAIRGGLPSGMYFFSLVTEGRNETRPLMVTE